MPPRRTRTAFPGKVPNWGDRAAILLVGGPHDGYGFFADEYQRTQEAARRMGRDVPDLHYAPTGAHIPHPQFDAMVQEWAWRPPATDPAPSQEPA